MELADGIICNFCGAKIDRLLCRSNLYKSKNNYCSVECYNAKRNPTRKTRMAGNTNLPETEYVKVHQWLKTNYGNAIRCDHCKKPNAKRYEWALKKGCNYEKNIENFIELCASCHRKYDLTEEALIKLREYRAARRGKYSKPIKIIRLDDGTEQAFPSIFKASKETGMSRKTLRDAANGSNNKIKTIYVD